MSKKTRVRFLQTDLLLIVLAIQLNFRSPTIFELRTTCQGKANIALTAGKLCAGFFILLRCLHCFLPTCESVQKIEDEDDLELSSSMDTFLILVWYFSLTFFGRIQLQDKRAWYAWANCTSSSR